MSNLRSNLIRLASELPKGSSERRKILAVLQKSARGGVDLDIQGAKAAKIRIEKILHPHFDVIERVLLDFSDEASPRLKVWMNLDAFIGPDETFLEGEDAYINAQEDIAGDLRKALWGWKIWVSPGSVIEGRIK